jgi:hypothetical protein
MSVDSNTVLPTVIKYLSKNGFVGQLGKLRADVIGASDTGIAETPCYAEGRTARR